MRPGDPIKQIDSVGRVLIPHHIRAHGYETGTRVDVFRADNGDIIVRRAEECCEICEKSLNDKDFIELDGKKLCVSCCRAALAALTREGREPHGDHTPHS